MKPEGNDVSGIIVPDTQMNHEGWPTACRGIISWSANPPQAVGHQYNYRVGAEWHSPESYRHRAGEIALRKAENDVFLCGQVSAPDRLFASGTETRRHLNHEGWPTSCRGIISLLANPPQAVGHQYNYRVGANGIRPKDIATEPVESP